MKRPDCTKPPHSAGVSFVLGAPEVPMRYQSREVAKLLAEEDMSNRAIADTLGVAPATIDRDLASCEAPHEQDDAAVTEPEPAVASHEAPEPELIPKDRY
jgi:hypothetical protein